MDWWPDINELNMVSVTLRLSLAMIFGGIVGFERGSKRRAAGLRTHMLVCVGSALVMITSKYIAFNLPFASDPARLGAQVISGIGFLGAGTILVTSYNQVRGLTTAAGLWASACLGLAIGVGFYGGALIAGTIILFIISVLHNLDAMLIMNSRNMEIYVEFGNDGRFSNLLMCANKNGIQILNVVFTHSKSNNADPLAALVSMHLPKRRAHSEVIEMLAKVEGILYIHEV